MANRNVMTPVNGSRSRSTATTEPSQPMSETSADQKVVAWTPSVEKDLFPDPAAKEHAAPDSSAPTVYSPPGRVPSTLLNENFHQISLAPDTAMWVEHLLSRGHDRRGISDAWLEVPAAHRYHMWPNTMLQLLMNDPRVALEALVGMRCMPVTGSFNPISDALKAILTSAFEQYPNYEQKLPSNVFSVVMEVFSAWSTKWYYIDAKVYYILFTHSDEAQLQQLVGVISRAGGVASLHFETLMHLVTAFGRIGRYNDAMGVLRIAAGMPKWGQRKTVIEKVCTTILHKSMKQADGYQQNTRLVAEMVDLGLQLNVIHYNVLLYNAFRARDIETAKTLFDLYYQVGIKPDHYTVATMLYGLQRTTDHELKHAILDHAIQMQRNHATPGLADHILRAFYLYSKSEGHKVSLEGTLQTYGSMFDDQILHELGVYEDSTDPDTIPRHGSLIFPTTNAIKTVLHAYMSRKPFMASPRELVPLYNRFKSLCLDSKIFSSVLDRSSLYNLFLFAFGRRQETVHLCLEILADMTRRRRGGREQAHSWIAGVDDPSEPSPLASDQKLRQMLVIPDHVDRPMKKRPRPYEPDVFTYNILLRAFMKHRHFEATSRILMLMGKHGISPNVTTWNTLASSYVISGNLKYAADTLNAMDKEGVAVTDETIRLMVEGGGRQLVEEMETRGSEVQEYGVEDPEARGFQDAESEDVHDPSKE
ncbi:hypothetical protein P152DRAFT_451631 [Eremomyces bilateralis CBS 781.70]|uniref:Pentatricopeptide repeat protein n=1 Tax=Eremomyces bilateralis CBS 781.70 TaxID=1392243 RepID=A0A6G1FWA7_9PEZI|nr:uncharacterized protein P152DRAFT_451631 [Eremomyces bilateralis CBS 781.70]KAF1809976.1 hypothetical protein P152DRAFT_451631 [Eremomyces bilateralis CBS 781.70]